MRLSALTGALTISVHFILLFTVQVISSSDTQFTSGIVTDDAVGTALVATGAVIGAGWTLGSHIHTLVAAPLLSIGAIGGSTALAGAGVYRLTADKRTAAKQTVEAEAVAA